MLRVSSMIDKKRPDWNLSIQGMFGRISGRYDLLNTLMSFGRDKQWRRHLIDIAGIPRTGTMLDLGAGTGEIALDAKRGNPGLRVVALDLTADMMKVGREKPTGREIGWVNADALTLPFADGSFDIVTSGYLMRNVPDVFRAFREQLRVVRRGGRVACLDTCPPRDNILKPFISLYFRYGIPLLGGIVSGQWAAYRYLPASIQAFKTPSELAGIMESAGFTDVRFRQLMFDTVAVLVGTRP